MGKLLIEAPEDVFVITIVPDGAVTASQAIVSLRSPRLERMHSTITALIEHIRIIERPIADGRIDQEIAAMGAKAAALSDAADLTTKILLAVQEQVLIGQAIQKDVDRANVSAIQARSAFLDAKISFSHAENKKNDMVDKITSSKNTLDRETAYLNTMNNLLKIAAPAAGKFVAFVGMGLFVKKGEVIGELNT